MYVLHAVPDFASLAVHLTLEEAGAPFALRVLDPAAGDLAAPAFRAVNPHGKIPALETPDGPMFESGAILLWLAERHALAPLPGSRERAAFLKWFVFVNVNVHADVAHLLHPERAAGGAARAEVGAAAAARLRGHLAALDAVAAAAPAWLSAAQPAPLAVYLAMLVRWAQAFPADPAQSVRTAGFPALHALAVALEQRPAVRRVAAREGLPPDFLSDAKG
jgi:glutathione S-transferase